MKAPVTDTTSLYLLDVHGLPVHVIASPSPLIHSSAGTAHHFFPPKHPTQPLFSPHVHFRLRHDAVEGWRWARNSNDGGQRLRQGGWPVPRPLAVGHGNFRHRNAAPPRDARGGGFYACRLRVEDGAPAARATAVAAAACGVWQPRARHTEVAEQRAARRFEGSLGRPFGRTRYL